MRAVGRTSSLHKVMGLCLCLLLLFQADALGQGKGRRAITPERLAKLISAASKGSPVVRPQAAQRLQKMGPVAHKAVLEHVKSKADLFGVGPELLEVAAALAVPGDGGHPELRKRFWEHVGERDFPWRAALVAGLGRNAEPVELVNFQVLLNDRLVAVRLAALIGLDTGDSNPFFLARVLARLKVETEGVARRALARKAFEHGHTESLWLLYAELSRADYFFDQPVGLVARLEASRFLRTLLPEGPDFDAQAAVDSSGAQTQRAAWLQYLKPIAGPEPKTSSAARQPLGEPILGLELRSCRRGEFFLRWTDADQLWVGRGRPLCIDLEPGTHRALLVAAQGAAAAMGNQHLTGQAGCDQESFHLRLPGSKRSSVYLITKGPAPVKDLRPFSLNPLLRELMKTLTVAELPKGMAGDLQDALIDLGGEYRIPAEKAADR
jgi:hypothetical protein